MKSIVLKGSLRSTRVVSWGNVTLTLALVVAVLVVGYGYDPPLRRQTIQDVS